MKKLAIILYTLCVLPFVHAQNLIDNGDFESDYDNWTRLTGSNGAMAFFSLDPTVVHAGSQSMRVSVKGIGQNPWDNQMIHKGFYPIKGEEYKLSFYASSSVDLIELKGVVQNTTFANKDFSVTKDWKKYEWDFIAQEDYLQLKFFFTKLGTVYLDDISIVGKNFKIAQVPETDTTNIFTNIKHQKIEGFGSALAFYESWVVDHPSKEEMYHLAFRDLGLDWLRIRNDFKYQENFAKSSKEFVDKAKLLRSDSIRILMCGWTPPSSLKNNNNTNNGTLKKSENGFNYDGYANYWKDALDAYAKIGIKPDWLSIQNEPDWLTDEWETCKFDPTESEKYPGYDKAFDAVVSKFKNVENKPQLLGSEMLGIGNNQFYAYNGPLKEKADLYGYAYHLYNGGDPDQPDSYNAALRNIKKDFSNKPNIMTEFEHRKGEWYKTAWLMNNLLTEANVSAYFYWDLIWPNSGLISIDNPYDKGGWKSSNGFQKTGHYFAFKHFSKHLDAGDVRVDQKSSNQFLKSSTYLSKDGKRVTLVFINPTNVGITTTVLSSEKTTLIKAFQSTTGDYYKEIKPLDGSKLLLPSKSVTTIIYSLDNK